MREATDPLVSWGHKGDTCGKNSTRRVLEIGNASPAIGEGRPSWGIGMTAEICVANRRALVLAADSAATVSQWQDGAPKDRYYKGANKIFHFSETDPVGIMIYDSAAIHLVPWETIIKDCRKKRGNGAFNTIDEYAQDLFSFVETKLGHVFTPKVRHDDFISLVLQ